MGYSNKWIKLAVFTVLAATAKAQTPDQLRLLQQQSRPRPEELLSNPNLMQSFPVLNAPVQSYGSIQFYKSYFVQALVSLEKAAPGATYGFLGRDSDTIADAMDAFFIATGQPGRVKRVQMSTPSFAGSTPATIATYLEQMGLNFDPKTPSDAPFVLVDYTSYGPSSQSTQIITAVMAKMAQNGVPREDIPNRFRVASSNAFNTMPAKVVALNMTPEQIQQSFDNESARLKAAPGTNLQISITVGIPPVANGQTGAWQLFYGPEWHQTYGPLVVQADGTIVPTLGPAHVDQMKKATLMSMIDVLQFATNETIIQEAQKLALDQGLPDLFSIVKGQRTAIKKIKIVKVNQDLEMKKRISKALANLTPFDNTVEEKPYQKISLSTGKISLTPNGAAALNALSDPTNLAAPHFFEISLEEMIELYEQNKIGARDFRRTFAYLLSLKPIGTDEDFVAMVEARYKEVLPLKIALGREVEREKYSGAPGFAGPNYLLLTDQGQLPLSCEFIYSTADDAKSKDGE